MVNLRNRAEIDFRSLTEGRLFLFNDGIYITVEQFSDDAWTNAVCIKGGHNSGHRCNFDLSTKVIPLSEVYIDYEI